MPKLITRLTYFGNEIGIICKNKEIESELLYVITRALRQEEGERYDWPEAGKESSFTEHLKSESLKLKSINEKLERELDFKSRELRTSKIELTETRNTVHRLQQNLKKERIKNAELADRINEASAKVHFDGEAYETFKLQYDLAMSDLNSLKSDADLLVKRHKSVSLEVIRSHDPGLRLRKVQEGELIESMIKEKHKHIEEELKKVSSMEGFETIYQRQSCEVKKTLERIGWFGEGSYTYKIGLLYDAARIHNLKALVLLADQLVKKCTRQMNKFKSDSPLIIPVRSYYMRESLARDVDAKSMEDIDFGDATKDHRELTSGYSKVMERLDTTERHEYNINFPVLPEPKKSIVVGIGTKHEREENPEVPVVEF